MDAGVGARKFEFCSVEWVGAARDYVLSVAQSEDTSAINLSFNEVFTDAPVHLNPDAQGQIGWYLRINNGDIELDCGILDEADLRIIGDYQTIVPLARMVFADNPDLAAEAQQIVADATAKGLMSREGDGTTMAQLPWLAGMHDVLARVTA